MTSAEARIFSSLMSVANAFQEFQPIGGTGASPRAFALQRPVGASGSGAVVADTADDNCSHARAMPVMIAVRAATRNAPRPSCGIAAVAIAFLPLVYGTI